jgi:5-carboxymethyl-2-hydroxymuconate isomerase
MPHLTLEYTGGLEPTTPFPALLHTLHGILSDVGIAVGNCKSRAIPLEVSYVGDGTAEQAFVHLDVRLLEGRPDDVKREIGRRALNALREAFPSPSGQDDLQITVELHDMQRGAYFKSPEGTLTPPPEP